MSDEYGNETIPITALKDRRTPLTDEEVKTILDQISLSDSHVHVAYVKLLAEFASDPKYGKAQTLATDALYRIANQKIAVLFKGEKWRAS